MAKRRAEVVWEGELMEGSGTIVSTGSGAFGNLPVSWKARTEEPGGSTSPEELIAAAHAACFSMALSNTLAQAGHAPERLETSAVCTFDKVDGGFAITTMELTVTGRVPGMDAAAFEDAAEQAKEGCPVSGGLKGNVEITVQPKLEE